MWSSVHGRGPYVPSEAALSASISVGREKICKAQCHQPPSSCARLEISRVNCRPVSRSPDSFHRITFVLVNEVMTPWLVSTRIFFKKRLISKSAAFV
jgi:hypothetical protein